MQSIVCSKRQDFHIQSLRLFHPDKAAPADFRSRYRNSWPIRITHAVLAKLDKFGKSASLRQLEALTQLDRCGTLPAALATLTDMKLAMKTNGRWMALGAPGRLFKTRDTDDDEGDADHWSEKLAYLGMRALPQPGAKIDGHRFSLRLAATYWTIRSFAKGGEKLAITNKRLRGFLGTDDQTVANHLKLLAEAKLINYSRQSSGYGYEIEPADHKTRPDLFVIPKLKAQPMPEMPVVKMKMAAESEEDRLARTAKALRERGTGWKPKDTIEMPTWEREMRVQLIESLLPSSMVEERVKEERQRRRYRHDAA